MSTDHEAGAGYKAVLFDWGGVLEVLPDAAAFTTWETRLGLTAGDLHHILWGPTWEQVEVGTLSREVYEVEVCTRCGFADRAALLVFYHDFYPRHLEATLFAALRALRPRYRTGLITNAWLGQRVHIERSLGQPITDLVDHYVNSAEVGVRKPTAAIYHLTLERVGVAPQEAIFIDDNPHNVEAAAALGLHAIHHTSAPATLAALEAALGHPVAE